MRSKTIQLSDAEFLSTINDIHASKRMSDIEASLKALIEKTQACYFWYMTLRNNTLLNKSILRPSLLASDYPKEFVEEYVNQNRSQHSPLMKPAIFKQRGVFTWNELFDKKKINEIEKEQLNWGAQFGVINGIMVLNNQNNRLSLFHLAIEEKQENSIILPLKLRSYLFTINAVISAKNFDISHELTFSKTNQQLSPREAECLLWAAKGKTIWETSRIIKLSENTVREYLAKAIKKLHAANKAEAIAKAILYKQIIISDLLDYFEG